MLPLWIVFACESHEQEIVDTGSPDPTPSDLEGDADTDVDADTDADTDTDTDTDPGIETGTGETGIEGDRTDAAAWRGPPRVVYGTGSFIFGMFVIIDPTDRTEIFRAENSGLTLVGCANEHVAALVGSFDTSGIQVFDADGGPVFERSWGTLSFPSAFTELDGDVVLGDENFPDLSVADLSSGTTRNLSLEPVADGDGRAEPRWMVAGEDGALWVGVERYNQLVGGPGGGPNTGAAITVVEPGADRATEAWPLGTSGVTSAHVVPHEGRLWIGVRGGYDGQDYLRDGGLVAFDLATRTLEHVVTGTVMHHVTARADGGGLWVVEIDQAEAHTLVSVDWDGTRGVAFPVDGFTTGLGTDDDGNLWVSSDTGLRVLDPLSGAVVETVSEGPVESMRVCR